MSGTSLITGAAGFIGSHLAAQLLASGEQVHGIDNFDPFYAESLKRQNLARIEHSRFHFAQMDIRDEELADYAESIQPDVIYHIAALAGVRPSIESPKRYASVNLDGLTNVLEAARQSRCRRVVFASSSSVYGNNTKVPFAETDPVDEPISPYAATKRSGELICHSYSHLFDMTIAALRFFTVYGPAQRPDLAIARFMDLIDRGQPISMFGDGTTSRDYTFIDDIISGIRSSADWTSRSSSEAFRIFNLGGSSPVTLSDLIQRISDVVGKPASINRLPMQPGDVDRTYADLTRSADELGYQPLTTIDDGLERQWAWMQTAGERV